MQRFELAHQRRQQLGLTQQQLAERAGVSINVVKRFEAADFLKMRGINFLKICDALDLSATYVLLDCEW